MGLGVVAVVALVLVGCGGSDGSSAGGDASVIRIGSSAALSNPMLSSPMYKSGMQAAVKVVNAAGGVKGRDLVLEFCDSDLDPNKESSCARELVSKGVVAAVGPEVVADQAGVPYKIFASSGIPVFGGNGLSPAELSDSNSYPMASGAPGWFYGAAKALQLAGSGSVAIYADAGPSGQFAGKLAADGLKALGIKDAGTTFADAKADPTFASSAAKVVASGAKGVLIASTAVPIMVKALGDAGFRGEIATFSGALTGVSIETMGDSGNGILVSSQNEFVSSDGNPAVADFVAAMNQYEPDAEIDDRSLNGYAKVMLFADILNQSETMVTDGRSVAAVLNELSTPVSTGLVGPWAVAGRISPLADAPRILNPTVILGTVRDGQIVATDDKFVDPFTR